MTQRMTAATPATRSAPSGHQGLVDTRILGKLDKFDGDGTKCLDWSYMVAVDARYQLRMTGPETSAVPVLTAALGHDETKLST